MPIDMLTDDGELGGAPAEAPAKPVADVSAPTSKQRGAVTLLGVPGVPVQEPAVTVGVTNYANMWINEYDAMKLRVEPLIAGGYRTFGSMNSNERVVLLQSLDALRDVFPWEKDQKDNIQGWKDTLSEYSGLLLLDATCQGDHSYLIDRDLAVLREADLLRMVEELARQGIHGFEQIYGNEVAPVVRLIRNRLVDELDERRVRAVESVIVEAAPVVVPPFSPSQPTATRSTPPPFPQARLPSPPPDSTRPLTTQSVRRVVTQLGQREAPSTSAVRTSDTTPFSAFPSGRLPGNDDGGKDEPVRRSDVIQPTNPSSALNLPLGIFVGTLLAVFIIVAAYTVSTVHTHTAVRTPAPRAQAPVVVARVPVRAPARPPEVIVPPSTEQPAPEPAPAPPATCLEEGPNRVTNQCCVTAQNRPDSDVNPQRWRPDPNYPGQGSYRCNDTYRRDNGDGTFDVSHCNWCEPQSQ